MLCRFAWFVKGAAPRWCRRLAGGLSASRPGMKNRPTRARAAPMVAMQRVREARLVLKHAPAVAAGRPARSEGGIGGFRDELGQGAQRSNTRSPCRARSGFIIVVIFERIHAVD